MDRSTCQRRIRSIRQTAISRQGLFITLYHLILDSSISPLHPILRKQTEIEAVNATHLFSGGRRRALSGDGSCAWTPRDRGGGTCRQTQSPPGSGPTGSAIECQETSAKAVNLQVEAHYQESQHCPSQACIAVAATVTLVRTALRRHQRSE